MNSVLEAQPPLSTLFARLEKEDRRWRLCVEDWKRRPDRAAFSRRKRGDVNRDHQFQQYVDDIGSLDPSVYLINIAHLL